MHALLAPHPARHLLPLDGLWEFAPADPATKPGAKPPRSVFTDRLAVPGVWECAFAHFDRRGKGWYRRTFSVLGDCPHGARLVFGAVSHTAEVWLDGKRLGAHYGAHTGFAFDLPRLAAGEHRIEVLVDNGFGAQNPLSEPYQDIYTWGGITRSVHIERLNAARIDDPAIVPVRTRAGWSVQVSARVSGATSLAVALDGRPLGVLPVRRGRAEGVLDAGRVREWSPSSPALHRAELAAGDDRFQVRIGFRTIEVDGRRILLNGEPLTLQGVNRHEFHPDFGPALPLQVHLRDIEILKRLGANFVRGSHYPNDPLFLDLCDEHGLLFWDELSHWQPKDRHLTSRAFRDASLAQAREMVIQHRHHPSVLCWGFLNETESHLACARPVVKELVREIKRLDPTRPTTFASHKPFADRCLDLVDIVSYNVYPGWYWCHLDELDRYLDKELLPAMRKGSLGKPVIMSEFGGAAMDGVRSFEMRKWTEQYQAELLDRLIGAWQDSGFISGFTIWQYCDVRTSRDLAMGRIREYNNKGILTEYREPKLAFSRMQEVFKRRWAIDR